MIEKLQKELDELDKKSKKLEKFMETDEFAELNDMERQLMYIQLTTMSTYGATLYTRIGIKRALNEK